MRTHDEILLSACRIEFTDTDLTASVQPEAINAVELRARVNVREMCVCVCATLELDEYRETCDDRPEYRQVATYL